jgi:hypothetical protein
MTRSSSNYERVLRWQLEEQKLVMRQSASKSMNMEAEEATALKTITRQQLVKI